MVAILDYIARIVNAARAQVNGHHYLGARQLCPVTEFVQSHLIGFGRKPRQIQPLGTLVARAYAVLPVVARYEVAARIARDRYVQLAHQLSHVVAEAVCVRSRMTRFVYAAVHRAPQMLDERAEYAFVNLAYAEILIQHEFRLLHVVPPPLG